VVVHHSGRLHERVTDGGADELEAASNQIAAKGLRNRGYRRYLPPRRPAVLDRVALDEPPEVCIEAPVLALDGQDRARVADGRLDLAPVPDDAVVGEQALDARGGEPRNARGFEIREGAPVAGALAQDRRPAQPGLCALEGEELEEPDVVVEGNTPFLVVVADVELPGRPRTAFRRRGERAPLPPTPPTG
jgi:hypothetical protein